VEFNDISTTLVMRDEPDFEGRQQSRVLANERKLELATMRMDRRHLLEPSNLREEEDRNVG
jgi:hypothetical protein